MTTVTHSSDVGVSKSRARVSGYPKTSVGFEWLITILGFLTVVGVFIDGWAHNSFPEEIETFLTPWHAMLYGGVFSTGTALGIAYLRNLSRGYGFMRSLPKGYLLAFVGFVIFGLGGGFDFVWHSIFGFEADVEALLSPAHLWLATGGVLLVTGPLRSAWQASGEDEPRGWRLLPALVSVLAVMSFVTFFAQYSNMITHAHNMVGSHPESSNPWVWQTATVSYVIIPTAIVMAFVLLVVRRWTVPVGTFTMLLALNALMMFALSVYYNEANWPVLIGALAGGIVADVLYALLKPSVQNVRGLRFFAGLVPFFYTLFIFIAMLLSYGMWWTPHMWLGLPIIAGVIGLGLSLLVAPPAIPSEAVSSFQ